MANFRESLQVFIDRELSDKANRQRLIAAAKKGLADAQASGKASKNYDTIVDRNPSKPIEAAEKLILFRFHFGGDAVQFALDFLRTRSAPSVSGHFSKSFWVSIDGRQIAASAFNPKSVGSFREIIIGNYAPYNRRIDVGYVGKKRLKYRTPTGLYEDAASAVKRQFGNTVKARRIYDMQFANKYQQQKQGYKFHSPVLQIIPA